MARASNSSATAASESHVHVCVAFNVKRPALPAFYEAATTLLAHSRADAGCHRFELQRELTWSRQVSNTEHSLFILRQEWESSDALEAHVRSPHAQQFDALVADAAMLVCAPSLSIFGAPSGVDELKAMAAAARRERGDDKAAGDSASQGTAAAREASASTAAGRRGGIPKPRPPQGSKSPEGSPKAAGANASGDYRPSSRGSRRSASVAGSVRAPAAGVEKGTTGARARSSSRSGSTAWR